jgi:hypothetical protein
MGKLILFTSLFTSLCLYSQLSQSQSSLGAISGAMAGAGRSSNDAGESYILNPAAVAHLRGAAISIGSSAFQAGTNSNSGNLDSESWRLSLNENGMDSVIGSSIYLSQTTLKGASVGAADVNELSDGWFTVGNFILPYMAAGISYHLHESKSDLKTYQEHNLGFGFLWTPAENVGLGLSFQNLKSAPIEVPIELSLGKTIGLGLLYIHHDNLRLRADYTKKIHRLPAESSVEGALGLENAMTQWTFARLGFADYKSETNVHIQKLSFGLGFAGPRFGIHYSFQRLYLARKGTEHSVDFMIPF